MFSWMRGLQRTQSNRRQARRTRPILNTRPGFEALEDRCVPSITPYGTSAVFVEGHSPASSQPVLTFLNALENIGNPNNYTAQISWGDANNTVTSNGTITLLSSGSEGSMYQVVGAHTYANLGSYTITVTIHDLATGQTLDGISLAEVETGNQHFVQAIYQTLLDRPVDASGYAHFTTELANGATLYGVVQEIENSAEYRALVVNQLYEEVLGRTADSAGLATWTSFLANGGTADQLEENLLGSQEYFNDHGQSNASFLQAVYQLVLQRSVDPSGSQTFNQDLTSGMSRQEAASQILGSTEGAQVEVQGLYQAILNRAADSSGLQTWSNALLTGETKEQVIANFIASPEYFNQVGPVATQNLAGFLPGL